MKINIFQQEQNTVKFMARKILWSTKVGHKIAIVMLVGSGRLFSILTTYWTVLVEQPIINKPKENKLQEHTWRLGTDNGDSNRMTLDRSI